MNLIQPILNRAVETPGRISISSGRKQLTYASLMERVKRIAQGLRQSGYVHDKMAMLSANRIEFVEVFLGAVYAGCVPVLLDPKWSVAELQRVIQQCKPRVIVGERRYVEKINEQHAAIPCLTFAEHEHPGTYDTWLSSFQPAGDADQTNELLFIGYTSGTTGRPRGYMRTHVSWLRSFEATGEAFQLDRMEQVLAPGPFVHSLSLFALMQSLYSGATFHILEQFAAREVLNLCSKVPDMTLFVVPTMIDSLLQYAAVDSGKVSIQAMISSGGAWSESSKQRCREMFPDTQLYEYYGSSEASYISYIDVGKEDKPGSLGRPFDGVQISIRDEFFREVPVGEIGQLYIRSEMMFTGYYQLHDETIDVFRDGWLQTGDYTYVDLNNDLYLAGRSQNMIKSGGLKVFPEEVEAVLGRIPSVQEVMVFGKPNDRWGEQVTALIQWQAGERQWTLDEVKQFCLKFLASYKIPKELIDIDRFQYTSSGKIARKVMKDNVERVIL
ncbi:AMP-binding protein [Paenibacillus glucanolyticus]|uniref:AMP-binding protein n=1 Tax=Paenibacillus glucanolyticus TaxID=59843 RepID=UPI0030C96FCA